MLFWLLIQIGFLPLLFVEFDLQVGNKQLEATEAMQRLPVISSTVASANEKTRRAEAALGAAVTEAEAARRMAGEAKEMAGGINQVQWN